MTTSKHPRSSKPKKLGMANVPNYYEINVAQLVKGRYEHLFATDPRSITSEYRLRDLLRQVCERFPAPAYEVQVCACYEFRRYVALRGDVPQLGALVTPEVTS